MLDKVLERAIKNVICNDNVIVILSFVRQKKSLECGSLLIQSHFTAVRVLLLESLTALKDLVLRTASNRFPTLAKMRLAFFSCLAPCRQTSRGGNFRHSRQLPICLLMQNVVCVSEQRKEVEVDTRPANQHSCAAMRCHQSIFAVHIGFDHRRSWIRRPHISVRKNFPKNKHSPSCRQSQVIPLHRLDIVVVLKFASG